MLELDVTLDRGRFNLAVRLEAGAGVTGLFGPSGSGKSTLLAIVAGLINPQHGRIILEDKTLFDSTAGVCVPPHRRNIGLVFQDSLLFPHYSVKNNLLFGFRQTPPSEHRFHFDEIVDLLELGALLNSHPRQISGGEKQRVALARALLASPRLLLLDEPLASLDQRLKEQILPFIGRIKEELGLPMIYVSHALAEILRLTDRLALIADGQIQAAGPLHEILSAQDARYAERFSFENVLPITIESHDLGGGCTMGHFQGLRLALPLRPDLKTGAIAYASVHRGEIALSRQALADISIQNQLPGRITKIEAEGTGVKLRIDVGAPLVAEITPRAWHQLALREGETVHCLIKTRSLSYLME